MVSTLDCLPPPKYEIESHLNLDLRGWSEWSEHVYICTKVFILCVYVYGGFRFSLSVM